MLFTCILSCSRIAELRPSQTLSDTRWFVSLQVLLIIFWLWVQCRFNTAKQPNNTPEPRPCFSAGMLLFSFKAYSSVSAELVWLTELLLFRLFQAGLWMWVFPHRTTFIQKYFYGCFHTFQIKTVWYGISFRSDGEDYFRISLSCFESLARLLA